MRKVIGVGETVTDIIIRSGVPQKMVCGGSSLNSMVTLGRCGLAPVFVSEVGDDRIGADTKAFLKANGVDTSYVATVVDKKSKLSLAFLNEKNDAEYSFYGDAKPDAFPQTLPSVADGDIVLCGSYYAINPNMHSAMSDYLRRAARCGAIIYYDVNFRPVYLSRLNSLRQNIEDNFSVAAIVRGSDEDFMNIFGTSEASEVYDRLNGWCKNLIITRGGNGVDVVTPTFCSHYDVGKVNVVSTIGAGDTFNAGVVLSLVADGISADRLEDLPAALWDKVIGRATTLSAEVCGSTDNYISKQTGQTIMAGL